MPAKKRKVIAKKTGDWFKGVSKAGRISRGEKTKKAGKKR